MTSINNAASYATGGVSPGENIVIFGTGLGPTQLVAGSIANGAWTTSAGGVQVLFDGVPAPLLYVSDTQINAVAPFGLSTEATQVQVSYNGLTSDAVSVPVATTVPGIFSADGSGSGQGIIANQDGSLNSPAAPASRGSIVTLYATGAGHTAKCYLHAAR